MLKNYYIKLFSNYIYIIFFFIDMSMTYRFFLLGMCVRWRYFFSRAPKYSAWTFSGNLASIDLFLRVTNVTNDVARNNVPFLSKLFV